MLKTCIKCQEIKELEEFVKDNRRKDGYSGCCKKCKNLKNRLRYEEIKNDAQFKTNKLKNAEKYRNSHRKELKEKALEYNNRVEVIERKSEWSRNKYKKLSTRLKDMINRAKKRAILKNIPFNISVEDLILNEYCPLLEIKLNWNGGPRDDNTPSLDRIISEKGYIKENICIISNLANMMKNSASIENLNKFSKNINKYIENKDIVRTIENDKSIELEDKELLG